MFGDRRLIVIGLICFAGLAACSTNPPAPGPVGPTRRRSMDITSRYMIRTERSPSDMMSGQRTF